MEYGERGGGEDGGEEEEEEEEEEDEEVENARYAAELEACNARMSPYP